MDGGIVELHALPDADGAAAQHDHLAAVFDDGLIFFLVRGVEVRHVAGELAGAGVDGLVDGEELHLPAQGEYGVLVRVPQFGDVPVGKAHALGPDKAVAVAGMGGEHALVIDHLFHAVEEEHVDLRVVADGTRVHAAAQKLGDGEEAVVRADGNVLKQRRVRRVVELGHVHVANADLQRAHGL